MTEIVKRKVYIETTVVSYYTARPHRDLIIAGHQEETRELWPKLTNEYASYISALVLAEAGKGDAEQAARRLAALADFQLLAVDENASLLAQTIIAGGGVPREYPEDALHVAVAARHGMDFLLTWNYAHLHNPFTSALLRRCVENAGYVCPEICSPGEFVEATQ